MIDNPSDQTPIRLLAQLRSLFAALNDEALLLRNEDFWHNLIAGGDIDLLVRDVRSAEGLLQSLLGTPLWIERRSYVIGYHYHWGHVDLFPNVEWRGAELFTFDSLTMTRRRTPAGAWMPSIANEAVICWLTSLLWGGFFKVKYHALIVGVASTDPAGLLNALQHCVGQRIAESMFQLAQRGTPEESSTFVGKVRAAVWKRALHRGPFRTVKRGGRFVLSELRLRRRFSLPWVAVLGLDGSGKTTAIARLHETGVADVRKVVIHHWRPHVIGRNRRGEGAVREPHAKAPRNMGASALRLMMFFVDWWAGYFTVMSTERAHGQLVVFDRSFIDLIADPRRYRFPDLGYLTRFFAKLLPRPDLVVFIDVPPEVCVTRKGELSISEAERLRGRYLDLVKRSGGVIIDGTASPAVVASALGAAVLTAIRTRTAAQRE